jgi:PGF-CTERM protein
MTVANVSSFNVPTSAKLGPYNKTSREGTFADILVEEAEITGNVYINNFGDSIVGKSVPVGTPIQIRASPNFGGILRNAGTNESGVIKIKITPPESTTREKSFPADAPDIDVTSTEWADELDTTGWKTGTATVTITSVKGSCNDLDVSSAVYEFTVRSKKLSIEAAEDEVGKGEKITLTVSGNPSTWYYFAIENIVDTEEPKVEATASVTPVDGEGTTDKPCAAWVKTSASGTRDVEVSTTGADDRTYTMNVYYNFTIAAGWPTTVAEAEAAGSFTPTQAEDADPADDDDVKVKVVEAEVTFNIPATAIIGEDVTIIGTVSAGDDVDILIEDGDDGKWDDETLDENDEFEVTWDTDELMTGTYTIDVYIDCDLDAEDDPNGVAELDEDGRTTLRLVEPGLTAEQLRNVVAEDDDYTIEGTASGVDDVDILLAGPKGYTSGGKTVENGLYIISTSVTDNEFSEDIKMPDGLDTGTWVAAVLFPGRDGVYGDLFDGDGDPIRAGNLADANLNLNGKTQSQLIAILQDRTLDVAGSDDDLKAFTFKVESGYVDLNPVEAVAAGDPLNLTGVTNREPETLITISTFAKPAGATDLPAVLAEVEWTTKDEGVFRGTIDTTGAVEGTYTLEADDGDGNVDTITVTIGAAVPEATPTPEPTAEPTAEPTEAPAVPTPEPTPEPTPTEEPGFEAVFAIAGLLSIAYLVLRRRK